MVFLPVLVNFGLIYKDKIDELQLPATDVAVIQNINFAVGCILGLISAPLINRYGCRAIAMSSGVFYVSGLMLTIVANDFITFLLSYGILTCRYKRVIIWHLTHIILCITFFVNV